MRVRIKITGQADSRYMLLHKLHNYMAHKQIDDVFFLNYRRLKDARKDLKVAYRSLRKEEPEITDYYNEILSYDAGKAEILRP